MAKLIFGMNVSLDGYVDHDKFGPDPTLFRHFIARVGAASGCVYGRRIYELMQYWDDDQPDWDDDRRAFARAWRGQPKWVVSRTLSSVGPNATLIQGDVREVIAKLKAEHDGDFEVSGTLLADSVADLVDEYWLYLHPVVLGEGKPFFASARPPLQLTASERIGESAIRLIYAAA